MLLSSRVQENPGKHISLKSRSIPLDRHAGSVGCQLSSPLARSLRIKSCLKFRDGVAKPNHLPSLDGVKGRNAEPYRDVFAGSFPTRHAIIGFEIWYCGLERCRSDPMSFGKPNYWSSVLKAPSASRSGIWALWHRYVQKPSIDMNIIAIFCVIHHPPCREAIMYFSVRIPLWWRVVSNCPFLCDLLFLVVSKVERQHVFSSWFNPDKMIFAYHRTVTRLCINTPSRNVAGCNYRPE